MSKRKNKKTFFKVNNPKFLPWAQIFIGLIIVLFTTISYVNYKQNSLWFNDVPAPQHAVTYNPPTQIRIPSRNINLLVEEAIVEKNKWQISKDGVSHLSITSSPGEGGNIVIYGHNKKQILGPMVGLKNGSLITLTTKDGKNFDYVVEKTFIVKPHQVEILNPTDSEVLTLYTCTGFADSQRFVVRAVPLSS